MDGEFIGDCTDAYKELIEGIDTTGVFLAKYISLNDPYKLYVNFIVDLKSGLLCKKIQPSFQMNISQLCFL